MASRQVPANGSRSCCRSIARPPADIRSDLGRSAGAWATPDRGQGVIRARHARGRARFAPQARGRSRRDLRPPGSAEPGRTGLHAARCQPDQRRRQRTQLESIARMQRLDDVPRGILLMIASTVLFAVWSAIAKWEVAIYPVGEVMFLRSLSSLIACAMFILPVAGFSVFATRRRRDHIARGLSQSISQTFSVIAFSLMPLAGAVAINFSAPLWAALLSVVFLKERAGPARWIALLVGFLGVLIVTNPGVDSLTLGALFALANAVMYGSVTVAVRGMTKTESANTLLMWQMVIIAFCHAFLLFFGFRWPTPLDAV